MVAEPSTGVAVVQHDGLAGRDAAQRLGELDDQPSPSQPGGRGTASPWARTCDEACGRYDGRRPAPHRPDADQPRDVERLGRPTVTVLVTGEMSST